MSLALANLGSPVLASRASLARERAEAARAALAACRLCAHECGVNRQAGERGLCLAGTVGRVFCAQVEVSDELELAPCFAIALSGCDLRCAFCITGAESWDERAGDTCEPARLAARAEAALARGARSVMILGGEPTVHLPTALDIVAELPPAARLVWKTNAHASAHARELLDGVFDVWVADYKFGSDACARRLARVAGYNRTVRENLLWASEHAELIVRHVLMPGHLTCCWEPVAAWLAAHLPGVKVNLRTGFWPAWQAGRHPELMRSIALEEADRARRLAEEYQLKLVP